MGIMANPFYVDLGYTKQEVATISKLYGVMVDNIGYSSFFTLTAAMGIPSLLLILVAWKYVPASKEKTDEEEVVGEILFLGGFLAARLFKAVQLIVLSVFTVPAATASLADSKHSRNGW